MDKPGLKIGGYIGLLSLLIVVALIALFFWRKDLFVSSANKNDTTLKTELETIKEAEKIKNIIETKNQDIFSE